ncbi:response regulator transcription factor [Candidatus Nitronereus thalassa]|uniref:Response regulator transcription factor n=1 Tax=Candidatus Nitronereus thalassa TaxID=3020898 RepID=A0ABU3KBM3_9BACT|nr:response regulator transcription factor [Candidatus Nitronereus thalassa]MDT7043718.1 response regulator transcription factor [Candidatus Nitronereus thalassa]
MTTKYTRVLIVDDHVLVLQGLQQLLDAECDVVGTSTNGRDFLRKAQELQPDIVLLDKQMPDGDGFAFARELKAQQPLVKIVFVTMHEDPTIITEAFQLGAMGYVLKQSVGSELVRAIQEVSRSRYYMSPQISEEVRETILAKTEGIPLEELSGRLTQKQRRVLGLIAEGYTAKEIGSTLKISASTVAFHKSNIMQALGVKTAAELTKYAVTHGITSLNS